MRMCGRYAITTAPEAILRWFKITGTAPNFPPHYNAAPGQELPVVRLHPESGDQVLGTLRWGLIPYWSKDPKILNLRSMRHIQHERFRQDKRRWSCKGA